MARRSIPLDPRVQRMDERASFWETNLSASERLLLGIGAVGALLLHLDPVLNAGFAKPLLVLLGVVCFLSPVSGFFFLAASGILPTTTADVYALARVLAETGEDTTGLTDSGTKYAFYSWLVALALRYRRVRLRGIHLLWPILPWLGWMVLTNGLQSALRPDLVKSLLFSVMACQLANEAKGQYTKCLIGLGLGFLVVTFGFWAKTVGLPVQLADWGGQRAEFDRLGSVVVDSVMLWPPLLCGLGIVLGVAVAYGAKSCRCPAPRWLPYAAVLLFIGSLPPLLAAMTNSGLVGLVALVAVLAIGWSYSQASGAMSARYRHTISMMIGGLVLGAVVLLATNAMDSRDRLLGLVDYYQEQSEEMGAAASRDAVWEASIDTISRYPLMGVNFSGGKENIPGGYAARGYFLSHNVFLDYGRSAGIPGMLLFAWFFFWPSIQLLRGQSYLPYAGFLLGHFMLLIFFLSLSFPFYKPFWAFWILAAMVGARVGEESARGRVPAVSKQRGPTRALARMSTLEDIH